MAAILDYLRDLDVAILLISIPVVFFLSHILGYVIDPHGIRSIPGPFLAKFSDLWLGWVSGHGHRSEVVHEMHKKYGPSQPNISIRLIST
jgi:benzoate 4-monooxygenase